MPMVAEARESGRAEGRSAARRAWRPRVCFVAPHAWPVFSGRPDLPVVGGAEVQQSILARLLARDGYPVSLVCMDYGQPDRVEIDGVTVHKAFAPDAGLPGLRFLHPRLTGMWRALDAARADVYYQRSGAMWTAVVAEFARRRGARSIFAGACDADFVPGEQLIRLRRDRWMFERGLRRVDRVVVQNERQRRDALRHYGRDSTLIPSCYQLPANARPGSGDEVLWVGVLRKPKRARMFVDIARRLPHRRFVLVGGNNGTGGALEALAREAAPVANLTLTGFLPLAQVEPRFDRARVLVNTSEVEGMPNTFLQAWARGVPTVSTVDVGARLRGEPLYPVVGSAEEAAEEVERLLSDPRRWAEASARCAEYFAARHSPEQALERYARLFDGLAP